MYRSSLILVVIMLFSGCSVLKPGKNTEKVPISGDINYEQILKSNITRRDFIIQKASVKITSGGTDQKFLASIKFKAPGKYLISIRSTSGIEAARIMVDKDTIKANDRINKKFYYGSSNELNDKYGLSFKLLPVMLGDLVIENSEEINNYKCIDGIAISKTKIEKKSILFKIDCEYKKVREITILQQIENDRIKIEFSKYKAVNDFFIPGKIFAADGENETTIEINIEKISIEDPGTMNFIPGKNYEKIRLK